MKKEKFEEFDEHELLEDLNDLLEKETVEERESFAASVLEGAHEDILKVLARTDPIYITTEDIDKVLAETDCFDNALINAHYMTDTCINVIRDFFIDVIGQNCIDESRMEYFENIIDKWDKYIVNIDNEFRKLAIKCNPNNIPINEFPRNTTDKEKELLNHLAKNYHIKRELSPNNKFPIFNKNGTKRLIAALYKFAPDYKDFQAFNFINSYIETYLPVATLQNYCREIKKDMPLKNV